jgi:ABC-type thiamin/hydroxymethylpyrimidine transport system permease subunit
MISGFELIGYVAVFTVSVASFVVSYYRRGFDKELPAFVVIFLVFLLTLVPVAVLDAPLLFFFVPIVASVLFVLLDNIIGWGKK